MNRDACISESTAHMCTVCVLFIYMGSVIVPSLQLVDFTWIPWREGDDMCSTASGFIKNYH